jgi:flagellar biosynthesis protein FlhF
MMKIKKFAAASTAEALKMVRTELGKDALILGTSRRLRPDRQGNMVEVVAALSERPGGRPAETTVLDADIQKVRGLDSGVVSELRQIEQRLKEILASLGDSASDAIGAGAALKSEEGAEPILRDRLMGAGIHPDLIDGKGEFLSNAKNMSLESLVRSLVKEITPEAPVEDVSVFVGPSGAGKTTTVLKIAAGMLVPNGAKPTIVYFGQDDGARQVQARCKKLRLKFKHVPTLQKLRKMLAKPGKFPVLIDTPGISSLSEDELRFFAEKARETDNMNIRLVVDSGMDPLNICAIASCLPDNGKTSLVLTKLDEATRIGGALSAAVGSSLPVSYLTGGSEIADGVFVAESEVLLDKVMDCMAGAGA